MIIIRLKGSLPFCQRKKKVCEYDHNNKPVHLFVTSPPVTKKEKKIFSPYRLYIHTHIRIYIELYISRLFFHYMFSPCQAVWLYIVLRGRCGCGAGVTWSSGRGNSRGRRRTASPAAPRRPHRCQSPWASWRDLLPNSSVYRSNPVENAGEVSAFRENGKFIFGLEGWLRLIFIFL